MILVDVVPFSVVTMVFLFGFSHVVFLIGNWSSPEASNFFTFLAQIGTFFEGLIGNLSMDIMTNSDQSKEAYAFAVAHPLISFAFDGVHMLAPKMAAVFFIVMCIILLNLLVAMMGDTYSKITEDAKGEWQMNRAQIIFSIEQNMSDSELAVIENKYWVDVGGKRYLQLEEEDVHVFDKFMNKETELARLVKIKADIDAVEKEKQATAEKLKHAEAMESKVAKLGGMWRRRQTSASSADGMSALVSKMQSRRNSDDAGGGGGGDHGGGGNGDGVGNGGNG